MQSNESNQGISRRQFLTYIVLGGGIAAAAAVAAPLAGYFLSPSWKQKQNLVLPIARADSIPLNEPTFIRFEERVPDAWVTTTESQGLWVVTKDGQNFTAFDPHCTHLNCPYYWDDQEHIFICPCHGGRFDIDGRVLAGPPPRPLDRWETLVSGGEIQITGKVMRD